MTDKEIYDKVVTLAKSEGYDTVKQKKDWNGYKVFSVGLSVFTQGVPSAIFVKGNKIRFATLDEAVQALFPVTPEMEKENEELKSLLPELFS